MGKTTQYERHSVCSVIKTYGSAKHKIIGHGRLAGYGGMHSLASRGFDLTGE
jgi:hypothetical protein